MLGTVIRNYDSKDSKEVLVLAEKYASWDTTPTEADLGGVWSSDPELFLVAEGGGKAGGVLVGRRAREIAGEVLRKRGAAKDRSNGTLARDAPDRRRGNAKELLNK